MTQYDPIFQEIPWDIITDEGGKVIGEVFLTLPDPPPRKRQHKWGVGSIQLQRNGFYPSIQRGEQL